MDPFMENGDSLLPVYSTLLSIRLPSEEPHPTSHKSDNCPQYVPLEPADNCEHQLLTLLCPSGRSDFLLPSACLPSNSLDLFLPQCLAVSLA